MKKFKRFLAKVGLRLIAWASSWAKEKLAKILCLEADELTEKIIKEKRQ